MNFKINYKIAAIFIIVVSVILFGIFFYLYENLRDNTFESIKTNLSKQTSLSKTYIEEEVARGSKEYELDTISDKIGRDLELRVTIIGVDGVVYGDSDLDRKRLIEVENHLYRPEIKQALKSGWGSSRRFSTTLKKEMLYVATTYGQQKVEGIIRLSIPLLEIEVISNRLKKILITSLFIAFIMAVIISFLVSSFISKPIREISKVANDIARGDFSKRIALTSTDEIGVLAKAFNYMSEQIQLRIKDVTTSRSRLEAVLLNMFEGVMVVDEKGNILLVNQTWKKVLCIKDDPVKKRPIEVIRNIEIQEIVEETLKFDKNIEPKEVSVMVPDEKILLIYATPIIRAGKAEGAVFVFHDITELRRLEKIRQDFVANVSHELRTPVASIKGYAETLLNGAIDDKDNAQEFLEIINSDSNRLAILINDLLDLSKVESGELKLELKPINLKDLICKVVSSLKSQAKARSVITHLDVPANIPSVMADEMRIAQVLLNLIDNAIKYNNQNGEIFISVKDINGFVQVDIKDTGLGIPENDLPRLFERFYRVDKAHSRELGGTGLGLAIVKHIIQAHNGEVSVTSVLSSGSTFSFTIPKA